MNDLNPNCQNHHTGGHKILIAYASEFGTAGEVAKAIGEVLGQEGNTVESKWVKHVKGIHIKHLHCRLAR